MSAAGSARSYPQPEERQSRELRYMVGGPAQIHMLVADDNRDVHDAFRRILCDPRGGGEDRLAALSGALFGGDSDTSQPAVTYDIGHAMQGALAVELARKARDEGKPFGVAFVDVRMPPGWNGVETAARLRADDPHLQIVLCTAYSDFRWDEVISAVGGSDGLHLLRKPFRPGELRRMAEVLGTKAARLRR